MGQEAHPGLHEYYIASWRPEGVDALAAVMQAIPGGDPRNCNEREQRMVEHKWELKIGATVIARDGEYGRLQELILDPEQMRITGLLVRPQGWRNSRPILVPQGDVVDVTEAGVHLRIGRAQLDGLAENRQRVRLLARPRQVAAPEAGDLPLHLRGKPRVFCPDGYVGRVALVFVDPQGGLRGFVLHAAYFLDRDLRVPLAFIRRLTAGSLYLSPDRLAVECLPEYQPDQVLAANIDGALWADSILRRTDYAHIQVRVQHGMVTLRGYVVTPVNRTRAEAAVLSVPGVLDVEDCLIWDEDLVLSVAHVLSHDPRTRAQHLFVGADHGRIVLSGQVATALLSETAEGLAAGVPGVRGVDNCLRISQSWSVPEPLPSFTAAAPSELYSRDLQLEHLEELAISDP